MADHRGEACRQVGGDGLPRPGASWRSRSKKARTTVYWSSVIALGSMVAANPSRPHGTGNHSAGGSRVRTGSRTTTVPARRSATLWWRRVPRMNNIPVIPPGGISRSTSPPIIRSIAWRKRIGAPSTVTARRAKAHLPIVRPRISVCTTTG